MRSEVIVIGAGGHAKVCIELLHAMGEKIAFCVGGGSDSPNACLGVPVLKGDGNLAHLRAQGYSRSFVAIGSNNLRERLGTTAIELGYQLVNAVSPHAVVSPSAKLGVGVAVMAGAVINAEAVIGDFSIINTGATVDHDCRIGKAVHIAPQCALAGNVMVGDYSFLGVGTKVIPEIQVGERAIVGAGAVVISRVKSGSKAVGVPAKPTGEES
jgi:UDP-perosamine 4-acetyltransferase